MSYNENNAIRLTKTKISARTRILTARFFKKSITTLKAVNTIKKSKTKKAVPCILASPFNVG